MSLQNMHVPETLHHPENETAIIDAPPTTPDDVPHEAPGNQPAPPPPDQQSDDVPETPDDTPDAPEEEQEPSTAPQRQHRLWYGLAVALLLVVALAGSLVFSLRQSFADRIYPNVSVRGVAVGEMTAEEARSAIVQHYASFLDQPVTLTYDEHTWTPTLAELGVQVGTEQAVQEALGAGRDQWFFENLRQVAALWQGGLEIPLHLTIDQQTMQQYMMTRAAEVERSAVDARLELEQGVTVAMPAVSGRQVLVEETINDLKAALQTLEPQRITLRTRELLPTLNNQQVTAAQRQVDRLLRAPLTLRVRDESYTWTVDELARLIAVRRELHTSGDDLEVNINRAAIRERLEDLADETSYGGSPPRLDWNGGDLQVISKGEPQRRINIDLATQRIVDALSRTSHTERDIRLPFRTSRPAINADNLDELGITELLATGKSDFTGSAAYRITNIKAGMDLLHGILVAPGEEFSFNEHIGSIDAANGFVEGYAIINDRTQLEWGGGICQDSTTMFRAAFWAGLPITERKGHSFYINWYDKYGYGPYGDGPGIDATIYTGPGGQDLRFLNDTGNWLLIQTNVNEAQTLAEIHLYGTSDGRMVSFEGPEIFDRTPAPRAPKFVPNPAIARGARYQSDTARGGMSVAFTRIIKKNGVEVDRERFVTIFKPWPNIFEVNPADMPRAAPPQPVAAPAPTEEGEEGEEAAEPTPATENEKPAPEAPAEQPPAEQPPAAPPPAPAPPAPPPPTEPPAAPPPPPAEPPPAEPPPAEQPPPVEQPPAQEQPAPEPPAPPPPAEPPAEPPPPQAAPVIVQP